MIMVTVMIIVAVMIVDVHEMVHCFFIAPTKTFAIIFTRTRLNIWVPVFLAVIHVRSAVIVKILAGALDSIVITLPLDLTKFLWRRIPTALCI